MPCEPIKVHYRPIVLHFVVWIYKVSICSCSLMPSKVLKRIFRHRQWVARIQTCVGDIRSATGGVGSNSQIVLVVLEKVVLVVVGPVLVVGDPVRFSDWSLVEVPLVAHEGAARIEIREEGGRNVDVATVVVKLNEAVEFVEEVKELTILWELLKLPSLTCNLSVGGAVRLVCAVMSKLMKAAPCGMTHSSLL